MKPILTDIYPKSLATYLGFTVVVCIITAVLSYGYLKLSKVAEILGISTIPALDITQSGSLFHWLTAVLWLLTATACFAISQETFRYNKTHSKSELSDIWFWGGLAAVFLSIDSVAMLRLLLRDLLVIHGGARLGEQGNLWWIGIYTILFGMIVTRITAEIWRCYSVSALLFSTSILLLLAAAITTMDNIPSVKQLTEQLTAEQITAASNAISVVGILLITISLSLFTRRLSIPDATTNQHWLESISKTSKTTPPPTEKPTAIKQDSNTPQIIESPEDLAKKR
ncbi:MAG: hypothetical protein LBU65_01120, partial [Planctomycetaceae bacterium]|nr:hypothetical protein [Planctomycetaceae bacterium]